MITAVSTTILFLPSVVSMIPRPSMRQRCAALAKSLRTILITMTNKKRRKAIPAHAWLMIPLMRTIARLQLWTKKPVSVIQAAIGVLPIILNATLTTSIAKTHPTERQIQAMMVANGTGTTSPNAAIMTLRTLVQLTCVVPARVMQSTSTEN